MHRMFRTVLGFLGLLAVSLSPGLAYASTFVSKDFFQPLAASRHLSGADHPVAAFPIQVHRPTQGANVMTATDCSMTRSLDGILHSGHGARDAIIGSVGLAT